MPNGTDRSLAAFLKAMREPVSPTRDSKDGFRRGRTKNLDPDAERAVRGALNWLSHHPRGNAFPAV